MCVCVREREIKRESEIKREREIEREREREREMLLSASAQRDNCNQTDL